MLTCEYPSIASRSRPNAASPVRINSINGKNDQHPFSKVDAPLLIFESNYVEGMFNL